MGAGDREKGGRCACLVRCIFLFRQTGRIWLWIHQRGPTRQGGSRLPGSPFEGGGWHAGSPLEGEDGGSVVDTRQMQILLIRESGGEQQASRVSFGKERGQQLSRFSFARIVGGAEAKQVILWEWGEGQQESRFFFVEGRGSMHAGSPLWG